MSLAKLSESRWNQIPFWSCTLIHWGRLWFLLGSLLVHWSRFIFMPHHLHTHSQNYKSKIISSIHFSSRIVSRVFNFWCKWPMENLNWSPMRLLDSSNSTFWILSNISLWENSKEPVLTHGFNNKEIMWVSLSVRPRTSTLRIWLLKKKQICIYRKSNPVSIKHNRKRAIIWGISSTTWIKWITTKLNKYYHGWITLSKMWKHSYKQICRAWISLKPT